jgi:hypothetical protein
VLCIPIAVCSHMFDKDGTIDSNRTRVDKTSSITPIIGGGS